MPTPTLQHNINESVGRIIQSDLVSARTAKAVILAEQLARGGPVTLEHCRIAAKQLKAKLRVVAAAFGWIRCAYCGEFIHTSFEMDPHDFSECSHQLDCEDDEMEAALAVYVILTGQPISACISLHPVWSARCKRFGNERPATNS